MQGYAAIQTLTQDAGGDPRVVGQLCQQRSLSLNGEAVTVPPVASLFFERCPSNISWFVPLVHINAIKRVLFRRPSAYVVDKRDERVQPLVTDSNSTPTVVGKGRCVWIQAPGFHRRPGSVFGRSRRSPSFAVGKFALTGSFFLEATTRLTETFCQVSEKYHFLCSAVTPTQESPRSTNMFPNDRQATKPLPWSNLKAFHSLIISPAARI